MSQGNLGEFLALVVERGFIVGNEMTSGERQRYIEGGGRKEAEEILRRGFMSRMSSVDAQPLVVPTYPANGEVFELSITKPIDGHQMVCDDGLSNWWKWKFNGKIATSRTGKFKLVLIDYQPNFQAVKRELAKYGTIPQGQWRSVFKKKYPQPDGKGPIGIVDASWVNPDGCVCFPYIYTDGGERFRWTDGDFDDRWRWLVEV